MTHRRFNIDLSSVFACPQCKSFRSGLKIRASFRWIARGVAMRAKKTSMRDFAHQVDVLVGAPGTIEGVHALRIAATPHHETGTQGRDRTFRSAACNFPLSVVTRLGPLLFGKSAGGEGRPELPSFIADADDRPIEHDGRAKKDAPVVAVLTRHFYRPTALRALWRSIKTLEGHTRGA
jgi:hypothetical protein